MVNLTINNKKICAEEGMTILEAAMQNNIRYRIYVTLNVHQVPAGSALSRWKGKPRLHVVKVRAGCCPYELEGQESKKSDLRTCPFDHPRLPELHQEPEL